MNIWTAVLDTLFPPRCGFCGMLSDQTGVCPDCGKSLPFTRDGLRLVGEFRCAVALYYDGVVKDGVHALKFEGRSSRAAVLGPYIARVAAERLAGEFDAVTYVPVSWRRNFSRGYDQARLLAQAAAREWGLKAEPCLRKTRHTRAQSSLDDPEKRRENVKGAYTVPRPERVKGRRFLLIDDVATTGSTLAAAASALMEAGAASVVCAALAGGHCGEPPGEPRGNLV